MSGVPVIVFAEKNTLNEQLISKHFPLMQFPSAQGEIKCSVL
jgi:hypothetical protein